jgi:hypothetical protein
MRRILIIALMTVHLFGDTELSQLFKMPHLITHFFQHQRQNPSITFFEFLSMHYGGDDGTKSDDFEDNKLPCHNGNSHSLSPSYTAFLRVSFPSGEINMYGKKEYGSRLLTGNPSEHVLLVLQPPKAA